MKYICTLNGKKYEVQVEKLDDFTPLTRAAAAAPAPAAPAAAPAPKAAPVLAAGTAGECKFYNVGDREAAMLMAIVASKTGKPLNQLRFISIREIKD